MTDDKATPALIADADAIGMRHLAWDNNAPGMASWPHAKGFDYPLSPADDPLSDQMAHYIVANDVPALLAHLAFELDRADRAEATLDEIREYVRDCEDVPGAGIDWYLDKHAEATA